MRRREAWFVAGCGLLWASVAAGLLLPARGLSRWESWFLIGCAFLWSVLLTGVLLILWFGDEA